MIVILAMGVARLVAVFNAPTDGWEVFEGEGTGFVYTQDLLGFAPGLRPGDRDDPSRPISTRRSSKVSASAVPL